MPRHKVRAPEPDHSACVIYARFSSDKQRDESIEDQVRVCSDWAEGHGLTVVAAYADRAVSGTSDDRPEFLRMVSDARTGNFGTVLVYKLDRFARDRFDAAVYRKRLSECGVALQSAMESIPEGPEGVILESVIDGFNEYYSRNLAQNTIRGMRGNAERCLTNGVRVYGYRTSEDGTYEVDETEAAFVRGAFERAAAGASRREVVDWLNSSGSRNQRGNPWNYNSVRHLLENEKYLGVYSFDGIRVEGGMPALVNRDTFLAAGAGGRPHVRRNSFPLSGRLFDLATGTPYRGTSGTSQNGRTYLYYSSPLPGGERRYPKDDVEEVVTSVLARAFREGTVADEIARAALLAMRSDSERAVVRAARERLAAVDRSRANILRAIERGIVDDSMAGRLDALGAERGELERRISAASRDLPSERELAEWVRTRLCAQPVGALLSHAVTRCAIDDDGFVHVQIPWSAGSERLQNGADFDKKIGEPAGKTVFAEVMFGSPYQIRTGDLRLERAAS